MRIAEAKLADVEHSATVPFAAAFVVEGVADCFAPLSPMQRAVVELRRRLLFRSLASRSLPRPLPLPLPLSPFVRFLGGEADGDRSLDPRALFWFLELLVGA